MAQFILFLRGGYETDENSTPEEIQQAIEKYRAWAQSLRQRQVLLRADKLADDGFRILTKRGGEIVLDGPFSETKETIGGYFIIEADGYEQAAEIARGCPIFAAGGSIELRQIEA